MQRLLQLTLQSLQQLVAEVIAPHEKLSPCILLYSTDGNQAKPELELSMLGTVQVSKQVVYSKPYSCWHV